MAVLQILYVERRKEG